MNPASVACRCIVRGRVQGVYFRASTRDRARALGLSGSARNLPDGTVEVVAAGPAERVDELVRWLGHGPPIARVDAVDVQPLAPDEVGEGFQVL